MSVVDEIRNAGQGHEPFDSVAALRAAHAALMRTVRGARGGHPEAAAQAPQVRDQVVDFLRRAQATGRRIDDASDRDTAQGVLDYWVAALLNVADAAQDALTLSPLVLEPFDHTLAPDLSDKPCPFCGLSAFAEADADRFFGRGEAVKALVEAVGREGVVLVAGPSGSGKSSLVLAGLVPRLKAGALPGSDGWRYLPVVVPGADPLSALLRAVCPPGRDQRVFVLDHRPSLERDPGVLVDLLGVGPEAPPAVLVIDQFEELFTLCGDQRARERFAEAVATAGRDRPPRHRVVLTVREDFAGDAGRLPAFRRLAGDRELWFRPHELSARELHRVIERPAELVGLVFEEGIVDDLVKEVVGEPTALPLLQFALLRLWEGRHRNRVTWDVYRAVGRPREALKRTADQVYDRLLLEDQEATKRIFQTLVQPTAGAEFVRKRVRRESLAGVVGVPDRADRVLQRFVEAGLIRLSPGVEPADDQFEVTHEALIRNWPLLGEWLEEVRRRSEKEIQLLAAARLWRESGRKPGYLLVGEAVDDAERYAAASPEIAELVRASAAQRKRTSNRRIAVLGTLLAAALVGLAVTGWALVRARNAQVLQTRNALKAEIAAARALQAAESEKDARMAAEKALTLAEAREKSAQSTVDLYLELKEDFDRLFDDPEIRPVLEKKGLASSLRVRPDLPEPSSLGTTSAPYDPAFLGPRVPLPTLSAALRSQAYDDGRPLDYRHYSVVLHAERKVAIYAAANHERRSRRTAVRAEGWFWSDPRVQIERQLVPEFFLDDRLVPGYLTPVGAVAWGDSPDESSYEGLQTPADVATNVVPQYAEFGRTVWAAIEEQALYRHNEDADRVTFFTGPVLRPDDHEDRGVRIPRSYWKIAVSRGVETPDLKKSAGAEAPALVVEAFLADQYRPDRPREPIGDRPDDPEPYRTSVAAIERLTGLDFGSIKAFDVALQENAEHKGRAAPAD